MKALSAALLVGFFALSRSAGAVSQTQDPWQSIQFVEGTWEAHTAGGGAAAEALGWYSFTKELKGHVLARHGEVSGCKPPKEFECQHTDLLYVYQELPGQPLAAIYLDNEGHVLHYEVSVPAADSVMFLSVDDGGPQFRLTYHLENGVMSGKFQMRAPGQQDWNSYLEWSGKRKSPKASS